MQLFNGDCLEVMKELPDNSIDFILTDLPYGTTQSKWDFVIPYDPMWKEIKRIRKDYTVISLFGIEPFSSYLRLSNIKEYKYDWIWDKKNISNPLIAKHQPLRQHELISIFYKKFKNYYPIKTNLDTTRISKQYKQSELHGKTKKNYQKIVKGKYPKTILEFSNANKTNRLHPTQKPVALLEYLIKTYTLENETVLDFTMGSGSTGVACVNTNRNFIGIELDREYYETATTRIKKASES